MAASGGVNDRARSVGPLICRGTVWPGEELSVSTPEITPGAIDSVPELVEAGTMKVYVASSRPSSWAP